VTAYGIDVQKFLAQVPPETRFDCIIADPPRGGLGDKVARAVAKLQTAQFTYVLPLQKSPSPHSRRLPLQKTCSRFAACAVVNGPLSSVMVGR
jgi:hypothetical protein